MVPSLKSLNASGNGFTNLSSLQNLLTLESLDLGNNKISILSSLGSLQNLRTLWLSGNNNLRLIKYYFQLHDILHQNTHLLSFHLGVTLLGSTRNFEYFILFIAEFLKTTSVIYLQRK